MKEPIKDYLGDGVYAEFDGNGIELSTERCENPFDAMSTTRHYIILEPEQMLNLKNFEIRVIAAMHQQKDQSDQTDFNFEQGGSDNAGSE